MNATRRHTLLLLAGALAAPLPAAAEIGDAKTAIAKLTDGKEPKPGRVKLDIPSIAENGNAVPISVTIESPMNAADHVSAIHLIAERNPLPVLASFHLGPRSGKAGVSSRIRLAASQRITAIAVMADGTAWSDGADVVITLAACLEE
jgi:sulfur-oxidizing protein SoxY